MKLYGVSKIIPYFFVYLTYDRVYRRQMYKLSA